MSGERTYDGEEAQVELAGEDARGKLSQEALEQAGDGVRIPVLIGSQDIQVALCR